MKIIKLSALLTTFLLLTGCIAPKSYVDTKHSDITYSDINPVEKKHDINIEVEFQRNGEIFSRVNKEVMEHVTHTFKSTGIAEIVSQDFNSTVKVTVNNVADLSDAASKGFATGLTLGLAGTTVTDFYEVTIDYISKSGSQVSKSYQHAIHTSIGNASAPPIQGAESTTPAVAFGRVVEQVVLKFIKEMQSQNILSMKEQQGTVLAI
ncbi:hypothetical protein [Parendozoicomonas haliclonae]|uniref:Lipoprotein n=1 Tax=Parendozoicomonas haliclonae TaxID=1960125 RepID=A0A1X7AGM6_9GAMM|nr:hypothetical protein [Parendozoicomonas haliclonae]SMA38659.1 hypothetical protein EHSB41UT_00908 [Parendozoicomonas haliclonae]